MSTEMKVCLVNPPPHAVQEPMYDQPIFVRPALACLGGALREAQICCTLVDAKFERLSARQVMGRVRMAKPTMVCFTAFTNEIKPAAEMASLVKELSPDIMTVIGGVHLTALPQETMEEFPVFDVGCIGQGETTLVELCAALDAQRSLETVEGLIWREGSELRHSPPRVTLPPLESLPFPAWDMLPPAPRYHLMTARGCPFACNFCQNPNGRRVRKRTVDQVIAEIEMVLSTFHPDDRNNIWFDDEIFTVDMPRAAAICEAIMKAKLHRRIGWFAQTHVNVVDRELLAAMKAAGAVRIGLGIESANENTLKTMGKGITVQRVKQACQWAREVDLPIESYFILGHPNETEESARQSIDCAVEINPKIPIFGIMVPYPGTHIAKMAQAGEGGYRLISSDWNDYNKQIGGALEFEHLNRFQLEWLQTTGYLKVFWANRRYLDMIRFIWTYRTQAFAILNKWARAAFASTLHRVRGEAGRRSASLLKMKMRGSH